MAIIQKITGIYIHIYRLTTYCIWRGPLALFTPLALCSPSRFPFLNPFTYLETLLPPWSRVTRKLTSPSSTPSHPLPIPNSQYPG